MNLIPISSNVLVNPDSITCVEQKVSRGIEITYIWVGDRSYLLEVPLDEFYKSLNLSGSDVHQQFFAG